MVVLFLLEIVRTLYLLLFDYAKILKFWIFEINLSFNASNSNDWALIGSVSLRNAFKSYEHSGSDNSVKN